MNYFRQQWEKRKKRNSIAKDLEQPIYRPRVRPDGRRREKKLNPRIVEGMLDNDNQDN